TAGDGDFLLLRFNTNGTLDATFGSGGIVITDFGGTEDVVTALALQSDQLIVAVGTTNAGGNIDFAVARYTTAGVLDANFDSDGRQTIDFAGDADVAFGVGIDGDGNIVVVGAAFNGNDNDFAVARLTDTGALDNSFGTNGRFTEDVSGNGLDDAANAVSFLIDGQIIIGGFANMGATGEDFALLMLDPTDGSLDNSFGTGGIVTTDFRGGNDIISAIRVDLNDQIVAVGSAFAGAVSSDSQFALARYISDGSLDLDFGIEATGKVTNSFGVASALGTAVAFDSLGRILAAGYAENALTGYDFALTRYEVADPFVLTPINEDPGANPPSSLLVDIVQGTVGAVAIVGLSGTQNGTWQYSLNGTTFLNFGSVSESAARLLVANATTRIRFLPNKDFNGEVGFSFVAWDQTVGTAGSVFDTTLAPAAFGGESVGAQLSVLPVNDAPVFIAGTPATILLEGTALLNTTVTFSVASFADALIFDVDGDPKGIAITALSGAGVWMFHVAELHGQDINGDVFVPIGAVSATNALPLRPQDQLRFVPNNNFIGSAGFTFRAWDDTAGSAGTKQNPTPAGGSGAFSTTTKIVTMPIGRNVAPVLAAGTPQLPPVTVGDNDPAGILVGDLLGNSVTDTPGSVQGIAIVAATVPTFRVVANSPLVPAGVWQFALAEDPSTWIDFGSGTALPVSATLALHLRAEDLVRFVPNPNFTATTATSVKPTITYRAWDQTNIGTVVSGKTVAEGEFTAIGTTGGIRPYSTGTQVANVLVNSKPTLTVNNANFTAINEDTTFNTPTTGLTTFVTVSDVGSGTETAATTGVAIIGVTGNGTWQFFNTATGTFVNLGSPSLAAARLLPANVRLRFVPAKNFNGTATVTLVAWDRTVGTLNGVVNLNTLTESGKTAFSIDFTNPTTVADSLKTLTLVINAVNDAPVLSASKALTKIPPNPATNNGDAVSAFTTISDVDGDPKGIAIIGATGTAQGQWQFSNDGGSTWINFPAGTISASNAVLLPPTARVRFVPNANVTGTFTLTFRAWDGTQSSQSVENPLTPGFAAIRNIAGFGTGGATAFSTATKQSAVRVAV
ncbi:MAG: hypothetical protein JNM56_03015, partial [Planctomycetia bacterium]|nr:hypothetical protein [Planctomycetia bacterium]